MLRIATRGSLLALWQARHVADALVAAHNGPAPTLEIVITTGDRVTDVPLTQIGERGIFTRELDIAILSRRADCGVHSLKDLPTTLPDGLVIAAILEREDARDAWLAADGVTRLREIPRGARVGTSSLRRRALLHATRPDLDVVDVRGNLDSRLEKLSRGHCDAMILALAGIRRIGRESVVTEALDATSWIPAPGQGAIAVVARTDDHAVRQQLRILDHSQTATAVLAERTLLRTLEGGCQVPIGAFATVSEHEIILHAVVADPDAPRTVRGMLTGPRSEPEALGIALAHSMLEDGAGKILQRLRAAGATFLAVSPP
ncbi:MAG: hydroxymethylbilane synthase [Longimicrobiales bacterium]